MRKTTTAMALAALLLSACATAPDQIAARPGDTSAYRTLSCSELSADAQQTRARLDTLERSQRRTRLIDTIGVALVFLPIGSILGGDHEREIGDLKWRDHMLNRHIDRQQCEGESGAEGASSSSSR